MSQGSFLRIFIILFAVGVYGSIDHQPTVIIKDTKFIGGLHQNNEVEMFLGLPFAAPPIYELRWEKPVPWIPELKKEIIANKFKPGCIQNQRIVNWYKRLILDFGGDPETFDVPMFSEDCLYLNLWRPNDIKHDLPVIVYIHGGSNKAGWSYEPNYLGHNIANKGYILISIPYRLGVFGFFSHPDIENPNLALYDQIMALKWIQEYISFFGGDPSNVTLVGESAGAGGISHLIASPLSKNLFHKAIHQSGGSSFTYPISTSNVRKLADKFANSFKDPSIEHLKNISAEKILEVSEEVYAGHYFNYVDDNLSVTENLSDTFKSGNIQNVDLLIGSNNDEWSLYFDGNVSIGLWLDQETTPEKKIKLLEHLDDIKNPVRKMDLLITAKNFVCPSLFMAEELRKKGSKTWVYQFNRVRDDELAKKYGAFHGAELPYVFDTHDEWLPTNKTDKVLTKEIQSYWLSFAKTGNPNNGDAEIWPEYDSSNDSTLVLDDEIYQRTHESSEICKIMDLF
tara:strand:- start:2419 stop:3948 length:1530 start_codon:yes stop_codon:yes gene_type:complete